MFEPREDAFRHRPGGVVDSSGLVGSLLLFLS